MTTPEDAAPPPKHWTLVLTLLLLLWAAFSVAVIAVSTVALEDGAGRYLLGLLLAVLFGAIVVAVVWWWRDRPSAWPLALAVFAASVLLELWDLYRYGGTFIRALPPVMGLLLLFTPPVRRNFGRAAPAADV